MRLGFWTGLAAALAVTSAASAQSVVIRGPAGRVRTVSTADLAVLPRQSVTLAGEGGSIVARDPPAGVSDLDLTFHLVLSPGTPPGRYPWPLHLAVRPLGAG